jgi:(p)ppGpp synthase/HD superfamily hydrolase
MSDAIKNMERLVEKHLGAQLRKDGSSNALHAKRVRTTLMSAVDQTGEMRKKREQDVMQCAALGHDLLEDSMIQVGEIEAKFGKEVSKIIQELTNTEGDSHTKAYVTQMANASDEARLIKYADLCDNIFHVSYSVHMLGKKWLNDYFLPIVDPMRKELDKTKFKKYQKTGSLLLLLADFARFILSECARNYKKNKKPPSARRFLIELRMFRCETGTQ